MEPDVHEVGGHLLGVGKLAGGVGDDESTSVAPKQIVELVAEVRRVPLRFRRLRHHEAKLGEECLGTGSIRQRGEDTKHVVLAHGEAGTDGVRIYPNPFEFMEQVLEPFRL